jgi:hypothetical protein
MMKAIKQVAVLLTAALLAGGCSWLGGLVGTQVEVKGSQRSLEEQVMGAFDQVGQEVYVLAGVRSVDPVSGAPKAPPPMTESESRALAARRRMEFNRDDVLSFKRQAVAGESSDGLLVTFPDAMDRLKAADPRRYNLVTDVVREENEDRAVVMQRIADTNPALAGDRGLAQVRSILAARYRQDAEPGMRVQLPDGAWTTKGS